jgi:hypothetical protein
MNINRRELSKMVGSAVLGQVVGVPDGQGETCAGMVKRSYEVEVISVKPGETLVVRLDDDILDRVDCAGLHHMLTRSFPGVKFLIVRAGIHFQAITSALVDRRTLAD